MAETFAKLRATLKPLPCPFCGESLVLHDDHHGEWLAHRDETGDCECSINQLFDDDDVRRWNRRATPQTDKEGG